MKENKDGSKRNYADCSRIIATEMRGMDGIINDLKSNTETGISPSSVIARKKKYGENSYPPTKTSTICELIMDNFNDPINVILLIAALVSAVIGLIKEKSAEGLIEPSSIMVALLIIISVGST
jgi:magnesium-transporting ATPase (P-type)